MLYVHNFIILDVLIAHNCKNIKKIRHIYLLAFFKWLKADLYFLTFGLLGVEEEAKYSPFQIWDVDTFQIWHLLLQRFAINSNFWIQNCHHRIAITQQHASTLH